MSWRLYDRAQARVLTERYLEVILGDPRNVLLLLLQAPAIAAVLVLAFGNSGGDPRRLYFVFVLTAIWFGCINACREIVKERRIFLRERMFNLDVGAYIVSKVRPLLVLNLVQCVLLMAGVNHWVPLRGSLPELGGILAALLCASVAGTGLGLLISALVNSDEKAVGLVPLVILPQIIFSPFVIDTDRLSGVAAWLEKAMIARWCFEAIEQLRAPEPEWGTLALAFVALAGFTVVFLLLARIVLRLKRYAP